MTGVDKLSSERAAMQADLDLIADIRAGLPAMRARSGLYLPKYAKETDSEYRRRVASAPWRPEFVDTLSTLSAKPFSQPVSLPAGTPKPILDFSEDVDGRGNNLHTFSHRLFTEAMASGIAVLSIAFPKQTWGPSLAEYNSANPRPYWILIPIGAVLACYTEVQNGREVIVHLRTQENEVVLDGFEEKLVEQIRVQEPGRWQLWQKLKTSDGLANYVLVEEGEEWINGKPTTSVQAVFIVTGERHGSIQTKPPLKDLAHMQVELFRALSRQDEILTYAGSPMLTTSGWIPKEEGRPVEITVGPKTVLFAGMQNGENGAWSYIQPDAANIREVREHVQSVIEDMQRLGLQPTITRSGDASATESNITAAKAHSALQAWALNLKDALEQALLMTVPWMAAADQKAIGSKPIAVDVHTDFSASFQAVAEGSMILTAEKQRIISKQTARDELARRGILGPAYRPAEEPKRISGPNQ